jgi:hypothetical protein
MAHKKNCSWWLKYYNNKKYKIHFPPEEGENLFPNILLEETIKALDLCFHLLPPPPPMEKLRRRRERGMSSLKF